MEYSILGIEENSSLTDAKKALKKVRLQCHPDKLVNVCNNEKQNAIRLLQLSEEAYERIKQKHKVNVSVTSLFPAFANTTNAFVNVTNMANAFANTFDSGTQPMQHTSTYSYSNINGHVQESGAVNGRQMSQQELRQYRSHDDQLQ
tara:strand:- start:1772 stop:2209 length:438 start_codon:yes stop_codon:yes gene_type:complete